MLRDRSLRWGVERMLSLKATLGTLQCRLTRQSRREVMPHAPISLSEAGFKTSQKAAHGNDMSAMSLERFA